MGNFSYSCGVCSQEVLHGHIPGYSKFKQAIVMWPNGDRMSGEYDGYGRIGGGPDLVDQMGDWKVVHQCCYNDQPYEELKHGPHNAPNQGFWPGERTAVVLYGEPDLSEFKTDSTYSCKECLRTWKAKWSGGLCPFGCERPEHYQASEEDRAHKYYSDSIEMVEPFHWLGGRYGNADGLVICRNPSVEITDWDAPRPEEGKQPTKTVECFRANRVEQARVTEPEDWTEDWVQGKPFKVVCQGCESSEHLEILTLTPGNVPPG